MSSGWWKMKEKVLILLFCIVLIFLDMKNISVQTEGRLNLGNASESKWNSFELCYEVDESENGELYFAECDENSAVSIEDNLKLYALSSCVLDAATGRVLYGKNENEVRAMASTTKILTCLLALENCSMDELVTVSDYAASMPDVQLNMKAGEQYRLYDLLLSLMLESHNDTAVAIAEHVGGSVDDFCKMMNQRALELGCSNSTFLTPNGLDKDIATDEGNKKHSTTAKELAIIMAECIKNEQFVEICRTQSAMIQNQEKTRSFHLENHNALLRTMSGVIAGKTGFTCDAGYCYVGAVERNGAVYICTLLGCGWPNNKNYKWYDMNELIAFAEEQYRKTNIVPRGLQEKLPKEIPVAEGIRDGKLQKMISLQSPSESEKEEVVVRCGERLYVVCEIPEHINAPIAEGTEIGKIHYILNGQTIKTESLTAEYTVDKVVFYDYLCFVLKEFFLGGFSKV